jgi:hypothetical protein
MLASARFRLNEPQVIGEVLEGEYVLVHFASGCYFSVRDTGADICNLLLAGHSVGEATERLAECYGLDLAAVGQEVEQFVNQLIDAELFVAGAATMGGGANIGPVAGEFSPPVLHRYDDMADQLLLDPIHEIDAGGWPVPKAA